MKNFLDDLSSHSDFTSTRTIVRIFWLCCSNQGGIPRQVRCPITLLLIRRFDLSVTYNCFYDRVSHQWWNNTIWGFSCKEETFKLRYFCRVPSYTNLLFNVPRSHTLQNQVHISALRIMACAVDFEVSTQCLFTIRAMHQACTSVFCTEVRYS